MRGGAILALALILAPALLPSGAQAQVGTNASFICFFNQRLPPGQTAPDCQAPDPGNPVSDAYYFEGDEVPMRLNAQGQPVTFTVTCVENCLHENGNTEGRVYQGTWNGDPTRPIVFPRDFRETSDDPVQDRAGTYNSTWRVQAYVLGSHVATRDFRTWLIDSFLAPDLAVRPGEQHTIRAFGFDNSDRITVTLQRRAGSAWENVSLDAYSCLKAPTGVTCTGRFRPDEAQAIKQVCRENANRCYRVVVEGSGKDREEVYYRVRLAEITRLVDFETTPANGSAIERTTNVTVKAVLGYPGGNARFRPQLLPGMLANDPILGTEVLRLVAERVDGSSVTQVDTVPMTYDGASLRWVATWTVPRDAPTNDTNPLVVYRLRIADANDKWGNTVRESGFVIYDARPATLRVETVQRIGELPRTEEGVFSFRVQYHNGSILTDKLNGTPLTGCFVRVTRTTPSSCSGAPSESRVALSYADGLWSAKVRYPRDYANLDAHRFLLDGGNDTWDNEVPAVRPDDFAVVVGSPRVELWTTFQGTRDGSIVRADDTLYLNAKITYGDGAPFNNTLVPNPDGRSPFLTAIVEKRAPDRTLVTTEAVTLRGETYGPFWSGALRLTHNNSETPLGEWRIRLDVRDNLSTPNLNHTEFTRNVTGVPLAFREESFPFDAEIGNRTRMRFSILRHGEDAGPAIDMGRSMEVFLHRYDAARKVLVGDPVAKLIPSRSENFPGQYAIDFTVPAELYSGTFVFVVRGGDREGNRLLTDAVSHPFKTFASPRARDVVTQPVVSLLRGDEATVVFNGLLGDMDADATGGKPVIHVDYFNPNTRQWEGKAFDVRVNGTSLNHVGIFPVTIDTNVGIYRFVLAGRQSDYHLITAVSQNFTVLPADVSRVLFEAPPESVTKGTPFAFSFERQAGDVIFRRSVYLDGRATSLEPPVLVAEPNLFNATWQVPFDAPSGKYTLRLEGADRNGNHIDVVLPPIEALSAQLAGKVLGNPARSVARGTAATVLFGVTYPTGAFYQSPEPPRVAVVNASGVVGEASVRREGLAYVASWTPGATADPAAEYVFEISGAASAGNSFPTLRSAGFRVSPGSFDRGVALDVGSSYERGDRVVFQVPMALDDQFAEFALEYYGTGTDVSGQVFGTRDPTSVTLLSHQPDPTSGRYVATFATDVQTPPGSYRITMKGLDHAGNEIRAESKPFLVRTTIVQITWDGNLPSNALQEGGILTTSFTAKYRNGLVLDDLHGRPSVALLLNGVPTRERPEVVYEDGHWVITWQAPENLLPGQYVFTAGGADFAGNQIFTSEQNGVPFDPAFSESLAKVGPRLLPAPGAPVLLLGLAALALVLGAWRRRA